MFGHQNFKKYSAYLIYVRLRNMLGSMFLAQTCMLECFACKHGLNMQNISSIFGDQTLSFNLILVQCLVTKHCSLPRASLCLLLADEPT
jgi:hypothetical protein